MATTHEPTKRTTVWPDRDAISARLAAEVDRLLAVLDKRGDVDEIWLIGSTSDERAPVHSTSDIDLVVVQRTPLDSLERALALRTALAPREALDLFVYTPEEFGGGGRFVNHVRQHGRRHR